MISRSLDERLFDLMDIKCRSISFPADFSLKADLESMDNEVKEHLNSELVDVVMEMLSNMREGIKLERHCDRKNPFVVAQNLAGKSWSKAQLDQDEAEKICKEKLRPLLVKIYGEKEGDRADRILEVCKHKCWAEQNMEDWETQIGGAITGSRWAYKDDAVHDELYANYSVRTMGFSSYPPVSKNVSIKLVCIAKARQWTAQNVKNTNHWLDYGPRGRQAAFEIAEKRAKDVLDSELVDDIVEMARRYREYTAYMRSGSGNPFSFVFNAAEVGVMSLFESQPNPDDWQDSEKEAQKKRDSLRRRVGDKADVLYDLCVNCAWYEQNKLDYDGSTVDKLSGEAKGYEDDWKSSYHNIQLNSYRLGFD